jgi:hypothetical protein
MLMKNVQKSGFLWIFAAATFLLGWVLMPDVATNNAAHILVAVAGARTLVWWSVVAHLASSIAFSGAIIALRTDPRAAQSAAVTLGAWLVMVGAIGICMDGFFHLVAYYMTAPGVSVAGVLEPMRLLQTEGIRFLAPLLLALMIGGIVLASALRSADVLSNKPLVIFLLGLAFAVIGGIIVARTGQGRRVVALGFLSLVSLAYARLGYDTVNPQTIRR